MEYVTVADVIESMGKIDCQKFPNKVIATMRVNGKEEKFQLDSGATVNIMSDTTFAAPCTGTTSYAT